MVPKATTIAALVNPNYAGAENQLRDVQMAATQLAVRLVVVRANAEDQFNAAFSTIVQQRPERYLSAHPHSLMPDASSLCC
jgi:hypothetical protein